MADPPQDLHPLPDEGSGVFGSLGGQRGPDVDTVGPAVEYVVKWTAVLHEKRVQEREVRERADQVYREMCVHEQHVPDLDDFPAGQVALIAGTNNLALRRVALEDEVLTGMARIHGEAKIERLLESLEDAGE